MSEEEDDVLNELERRANLIDAARVAPGVVDIPELGTRIDSIGNTYEARHRRDFIGLPNTEDTRSRMRAAAINAEVTAIRDSADAGILRTLTGEAIPEHAVAENAAERAVEAMAVPPTWSGADFSLGTSHTAFIQGRQTDRSYTNEMLVNNLTGNWVVSPGGDFDGDTTTAADEATASFLTRNPTLGRGRVEINISNNPNIQTDESRVHDRHMAAVLAQYEKNMLSPTLEVYRHTLSVIESQHDTFLGVDVAELMAWKDKNTLVKDTVMSMTEELEAMCTQRQETHLKLMTKLSAVIDKYPFKAVQRCVPPDIKIVHRLSGHGPLSYMTKYERISPLDYQSLDALASILVGTPRRLVFFDKYNFTFVRIPLKFAPVTKKGLALRLLASPEVLANGFVIATIGRKLKVFATTKKALRRKRIYLSSEVPMKALFDDCPEILEYYNNGKQERHDLRHTRADDESGPIEVFGDISDIDSDLLVQEQIAALSET